MLSVKQGGIKYHFWVFGKTRPGIETIGEHSNHYVQYQWNNLTVCKQMKKVE